MLLADRNLRRRAPPQRQGVEQACAQGLTLIQAGRAVEALPALQAAVRRYPGNGHLLHLVGHALYESGQRGPAIGAFYSALDARPDDPAIHGSLARALLAEIRLDDAERHGQIAFRDDPSSAHAINLSCILIELGRFREAFRTTTIVADQTAPELLINRSIALEGLGQTDAALAAARAAVACGPNSVIEHHLAALLLAQGHLTAEAWSSYEARLRLPGISPLPPGIPRWEGEDPAGQTILVHAEQGLGDTIQFVRYVPLLAERGARVVLVVQPTLKRLLSATPGANEVLAVGETWPAFDLYCPLLSLPGLFGTTMRSIPPPRSDGFWQPLPGAEIRANSGALRVGLAWAGSPGFVENRKRSMPGHLLARLADVPGVNAVGLQVPTGPMPYGLPDFLSGVTDMADSAARLATLDLVITVDTATAHLAATLGIPVWLLSRFRGCWRWLQDCDDTPWYPGMTLYRQARPNDWLGVLARVQDDLARAAWRKTGGIQREKTQ